MTGALTGKRIGLLTAQASRLGGGVFEAVIHQAKMIRDMGGEPIIFALQDRYTAQDAVRLAPSRVISVPVLGPKQIGFAPNLLPQLLAADLDCLHLHGIWMYPSYAARRWVHKTGRRYVISAHGMLNPWITARGRLKKALARAGYERASWQAADQFHALTDIEAADIAAETGRRDIAVIPNPAPPLSPIRSAMPPPTIVCIGRIHAVKNVLALIDGWTSAGLDQTASLVIAGWGADESVAELNAAIAKAGPGITFLGPVYGTDKAALLGSARFAILPSLTEALPMAALDAWAAGVPVIMTPQCNLSDAFICGAAIECATGAQEIASALQIAIGLNGAEWLQMTKAGQDFVTNRFSASAVAGQWLDVYDPPVEQRL
ncbi:glycosyltransferase [Novosphingobium sp.]|uniref:glycosyltransferase n=1 Tax=Novosphingobium sp. TaxID=1874826 RepID=UPI0025CF56F7|nr:glycosyltransferase [Novosphingobium sp.]